MTMIERVLGGSRGRAQTVVWNSMVWTVGVAPGDTVAEQTRRLLAMLDDNLNGAGTSKERILEATVYLADMATKAEMDEVWCSWIPDGGWPCRACVQSGLAPGDLVEIKLLAALPSPGD